MGHNIDRTSNSTITQALDLQLCFPTGETQNLTFFVTPLDHSCMIVLGYHWLTRFNQSIDWVLGCIAFFQMLQQESEHVFSCSNRLAACTRDATPFHQRQLISQWFDCWNQDKYAECSE